MRVADVHLDSPPAFLIWIRTYEHSGIMSWSNTIDSIPFQ